MIWIYLIVAILSSVLVVRVANNLKNDYYKMRVEIYFRLRGWSQPWIAVIQAQTILETGWYKSQVFNLTKNMFGMGFANKRENSQDGVYKTEVANEGKKQYASYKSIKRSMQDYALYIKYWCDTYETGENGIDLLRQYNFEQFKKETNIQKILSFLNSPVRVAKGPSRNYNYASDTKYNEKIQDIIESEKLPTSNFWLILVISPIALIVLFIAIYKIISIIRNKQTSIMWRERNGGKK